MSSIFVQIASYRDTELLPTLRDIVAKSSKKHDLTFGVVWQKDDTESVGEFANDSRVRIIDVMWNKSGGLGWARNLCQSLYGGEDYTLQLDSHHRFAPDWDQTLIDMMVLMGQESKKPFLTAYASGYDPLNDKHLVPTPCRILPHDFKESGTIWFNPTSIPNWQLLKKPINARLVSGHYFFTLGKHCKEYVYDPLMYFAGDEITLSARSYTLGYDLYHPHKNVVWHHYGRYDRKKHWGDHNQKEKDEGLVDNTWLERDILSKKRIRQLLGEEDSGIDLGIYGLGKERALGEYERYCGFDFKNRRIHKAAIDGEDPPAKYENDDQWEGAFKKVVPFSTTEWPRYQYLQNLDQLTHVNVSFMCLKKTIVYSCDVSLDSVKNAHDNKFQVSFEADNVPMKVIFKGMNKTNEVSKWERDLRAHVHWF